MARINLLPWRAERRERKNKEFLTVVIVVIALAGLAAFSVWFYFNQEFQKQQEANKLITEENAKLDNALKEIETLEQRRDDIISRMKVIQDLQGKRPIPVRIWSDLLNAVPDYMYLTKLERSGDIITLTGKADNPNIVSELIKRLDNGEWFHSSAVRNIKKPPEKNLLGSPSTLNNNKPPTKQEEQANILYPEDNYVEFVITTTVQSVIEGESKDGEQAKNGQAAAVTQPEQGGQQLEPVQPSASGQQAQELQPTTPQQGQQAQPTTPVEGQQPQGNTSEQSQQPQPTAPTQGQQAQPTTPAEGQQPQGNTSEQSQQPQPAATGNPAQVVEPVQNQQEQAEQPNVGGQ